MRLTFQQTLYNGVDVQLIGFCHAIPLFRFVSNNPDELTVY